MVVTWENAGNCRFIRSVCWKENTGLRSLNLTYSNCTQLYQKFFYGGFDGSSKNTRLLHKKTGLQVSAVGILLLMLVFAQVHHYSIEEPDAPEERRITALKSCAGNEENINAAAG